MSTPLAHSSSSVARLMTGALSHQAGWQEPVAVPQPAAGQPWVYPVNGVSFERLVSIRFVLTTSVVVANRYPVVQLLDMNQRVTAVLWAGGTMVASQVSGVTLAGGVTIQSNYGGNEVFGPLPDFLVPLNYTWKCVVQNMDVADQLSGIVLQVQRFPNDTINIPSDF